MAGPSAFFSGRRLTPPSEHPSAFELDARKAELRDLLRRRRADAAAVNGAAVAATVAERFLAAVPVQPGMVVSGYWPMADELDPRPLLRRLQAQGAVIVLPGVAPARGTPLIFRRWDDLDAPPPPGAFRIPSPPADAPILRPDMLLVPLVGFDSRGHRLGLGGGFYDATLDLLRRQARDGGRPVRAIGLAFAIQEVQRLPDGPMDERLDWIVTERAAVAFGR